MALFLDEVAEVCVRRALHHLGFEGLLRKVLDLRTKAHFDTHGVDPQTPQNATARDARSLVDAGLRMIEDGHSLLARASELLDEQHAPPSTERASTEVHSCQT